jgi:hypothetical protein
MARHPPPTSFADTAAARGIAALVLVLVILSLIWLHRHDLFLSEQPAASNPALAACIAERVGHVETMQDEGVITPQQAESFRARAIQFCEQTVPATPAQ